MTKQFNQLFYDSKSWKKIMTFEKITLTPELAADLLTLNTKEETAEVVGFKNRKRKEKVLERYIRDVKTGRWRYTGETIKIGSNGQLLDGQHRCMAVIAAKTPIILDIKTGLDPSIFKVLDTGSVRTTADVASIAGFKYSTHISGVALLIEAYEKKLSFEAVGKEKNNHEVALERMAKYDKDLLEDSCRFGGVCKNSAKFINANIMSVLYYMIAGAGRKDKIEEFGHLLSSGDGLGSTSNSSIWLLREKLISNANSTSKLRLNALAFLMFSTWNAFYKGKSMKRLPKFTDSLTVDILV